MVFRAIVCTFNCYAVLIKQYMFQMFIIIPSGLKLDISNYVNFQMYDLGNTVIYGFTIFIHQIFTWKPVIISIINPLFCGSLISQYDKVSSQVNRWDQNTCNVCVFNLALRQRNTDAKKRKVGYSFIYSEDGQLDEQTAMQVFQL